MHSKSIDENKDFLARLTRFSKWHQLKRPFPGYSLSSLSKASLALEQGEADTTQVDVTPLIEQLDRAEKTVLKLVQSGAFPKEMGALQKFQRADSKTARQFTKVKKSEIKK